MIEHTLETLRSAAERLRAVSTGLTKLSEFRTAVSHLEERFGDDGPGLLSEAGIRIIWQKIKNGDLNAISADELKLVPRLLFFGCGTDCGPLFSDAQTVRSVIFRLERAGSKRIRESFVRCYVGSEALARSGADTFLRDKIRLFGLFALLRA